MKYEDTRREIIASCLEMNRRGLNQGVSGNISVRVPEGFLITPSGMDYDEMTPADAALVALEGRSACLLANHGMIAIGPTLKKAIWLAAEVENLAAQYWRALQVGEPFLLTDEELAATVEQFKNYGQGGASAGETPRCC